MGCDDIAYIRVDFDYKEMPGSWKVIGRGIGKVGYLSASPDALWITDYDTYMPYKYDDNKDRFYKMGVRRQGWWIQAGMNGHAVMRGYTDRKAYVWIPSMDK